MDFDRVLSERGRQDAGEMGKRLQILEIQPDIVICSSAWRAVQTLEMLAPGMNVLKEDVIFKKSMYEAATSTLLQIVQELNDSMTSAMLIGHNPSMSWLVSHLTGEEVTNMPACTVATLRMPSSHWKDAGSMDCELSDLYYPQ